MAAQLIGVDYLENGQWKRETIESAEMIAEFTQGLDSRGIEWLAVYGPGWR